MSAVADLMTDYDYSSRDLESDRLDRGRMPADPRRKWGRRVDREFAEHHIRLIRAMEPARWEYSRFQNDQHLNWDEDEIITIRECFATGEYSLSALAKFWRCSRATIRRIVRGDAYAYFGGPITNQSNVKQSA